MSSNLPITLSQALFAGDILPHRVEAGWFGEDEMFDEELVGLLDVVRVAPERGAEIVG